MGKCIACRPRLVSIEGADHTGRDFFLKCSRCGTRTVNHVEANYPGDAEPILRKEWKAGRTQDFLGRASSRSLLPDQSGESKGGADGG